MEHGFAHDREDTRAREDIPCAGPRRHAGSSRCRRTVDGYVVTIDAPESLPVTGDEIALLRAFLYDEIWAILHGEDQEG